MRRKVMASYLLGMAIVFPLAVHHTYFDILETKHYFFVFWTMTAALGLALAGLFQKTGGPDETMPDEKITKTMGKPVVMAGAALLFLALCSTLLSPERTAAFSGNAGRYQGFLTLLVYGAFFYIAGSTDVSYDWFPGVFCLSGSVVCALGIAQYFMADPFGWLAQIQAFERRMFYSTIGYSNFYSCYAALVAAVSMGMYGAARTKWDGCWLFSFVLSCMALLTGSSDGGFLAFGAAYLIMPFIIRGKPAFRTNSYRHLLLGGLFCAAAYLLGCLSNGVQFAVRELNPGLGVTLLNSRNLLLPVTLLLFAGAGGLAFLERRYSDQRVVACYRGFLLVLVVAALLFLAAGGHMTALFAWGPRWGTGRGMIWSVAWEEWRTLDGIHRLFGTGPDTAVFLLALRRAEFEAVLGYGDINNVHNECLQYLVTLGVAGALAYLIFLAVCLRRIWQEAARCPWKYGLLLGVAAYLAQSVVSINQSVTTPWLFLFLALGVRRTDREEETAGKESKEQKLIRKT